MEDLGEVEVLPGITIKRGRCRTKLLSFVYVLAGEKLVVSRIQCMICGGSITSDSPEITHEFLESHPPTHSN